MLGGLESDMGWTLGDETELRALIQANLEVYSIAGYKSSTVREKKNCLAEAGGRG